MTDMEVDEIFDCAFVSVSKKIASLNLKRNVNRELNGEDSYTGSVYTKGSLILWLSVKFHPMFMNILYML